MRLRKKKKKTGVWFVKESEIIEVDIEVDFLVNYL